MGLFVGLNVRFPRNHFFGVMYRTPHDVTSLGKYTVHFHRTISTTISISILLVLLLYILSVLLVACVGVSDRRPTRPA